MILRLALVLSLLAFHAAQAAAEGMYVELEVGPSFFADSELSGGPPGELEYDTGFNIGGAFGVRAFEIVRAELGLNYRRADTDEVNSTPVSGDVGIFATMANVYLDPDLDLPVTPYVGAGFGLGIVLADFRYQSSNVDDEEAEFAYNFMGGFAFEVAESVVLDAGYRYFATTDADIRGVDMEFDVHELVFAVRYEF